MQVKNYLKFFFMIAFVFIFLFESKGQTQDPIIQLKGELPGSNLRVYLQRNGISHQAKIFINYSKAGKTYNLQMDSAFDSDVEMVDTFIVQQLKPVGSKQLHVMFTWKSKESTNLGEHGAYHYYKTNHQIWNVDAGIKLYTAISESEYESNYMHWPEEDSTFWEEITNCSYHYDFKIETNGKISIQNIKENLQGNCSAYTADHRAGMYALYGGKYVRVGP